jgi:ubiquinone/menaquinone biosynthesis C-methylase UbiE
MIMPTLSRVKYWASQTLSPKLYWNLMGQFKPVPAVTSDYHNVDDCLASGLQVVDLLDDLGVLRPDAVTLHIGAGLGRVEAHLRQRVATCYGADISQSMVRRARLLVPYDNVEFFVIDGQGLSGLPVSRFDLIYSFLVFQHLPRPHFFRYIHETFSHLSEDGHFVFQLMVDETGTRTDPPATHPYGLRYYRRADVQDELLQAGFATVTRCTLDGAPDDDGSSGEGTVDVVFCAAR